MSDPGTQQENGAVYYVLCKTQHAERDLSDFILRWRQCHDLNGMYIDQCTSELAYRSMDGEADELTRLAAENEGLRFQNTRLHSDVDRLRDYVSALQIDANNMQAENARLREACRAALVDISERIDQAARQAEFAKSRNNEESRLSWQTCCDEASKCADILRHHLAAAEAAEKESDHAE